MLILKRKVDETVFVDGPCFIHVKETNRQFTRLAFSAPMSTVVLRLELLTVGELAAMEEQLRDDAGKNGTSDA